MKTKLILAISIPLLVGAIGAYFTSQGVNSWYLTINKPSFNPPNYLFGPVWTVLYLLMGIGLFMILKSEPYTLTKNLGILVFGLQLIFNFCWSFLFFKYQNIGLALIDIFLMLASIIWMISIWYKVNKKAALLQIPYLLWVSFATILNATIWFIN